MHHFSATSDVITIIRPEEFVTLKLCIFLMLLIVPNPSVSLSALMTLIDFTRMKVMLYEVRCLKSTEDMILALARQFKQLSYEPEKFR